MGVIKSSYLHDFMTVTSLNDYKDLTAIMEHRFVTGDSQLLLSGNPNETPLGRVGNIGEIVNGGRKEIWAYQVYNGVRG